MKKTIEYVSACITVYIHRCIVYTYGGWIYFKNRNPYVYTVLYVLYTNLILYTHHACCTVAGSRQESEATMCVCEPVNMRQQEASPSIEQEESECTQRDEVSESTREEKSLRSDRRDPQCEGGSDACDASNAIPADTYEPPSLWFPIFMSVYLLYISYKMYGMFYGNTK